MDKNSLFYVFNFFTTWMIIFVIFHKYVYRHINLLYLSFITLVCGLYFSFINPRRFVLYIDNVRYEYNGIQKFIIVDLFFHILVFTYIYCMYSTYYRCVWDRKMFLSLIILMLYLSLVNIKRTYGVNLGEILIVVFVANLMYFMLYI